MGQLFILFLLLPLIILVDCQSDYVIYRNVMDYGATGNGVTDDTQAIITALTQGRADGNPNQPYGPGVTYSSSTQHPAYIYFPYGTYLVSQPLPFIYNTQIFGDHNDLPTIKYVANGKRAIEALDANWGKFVRNQDNFYHGLWNFVIDMTDCEQCVGVHWQVAQATSIVNVVFKMSSTSQGIWMENGSGGFISDLIFEGGTYGMWVGNQQFTSRNITIRNAGTGIYLNWDWGWTFKSLTIENCDIAIDVAAGIGSVTLIDSTFINCNTGIQTSSNAPQPGDVTVINSVVIDNLNVQATTNVVVNNQSPTLVVSDNTTIASWVQGHIWTNQNQNEIGTDSTLQVQRPSILLNSDGTFFEKSCPQFDIDEMVNVTNLGVVGDNSTIVTTVLQKVLLLNVGKVLFFPHGTYLIDNTVTVPPGSILIGQVWSVLMAVGPNFSDENNPIPMLRVGKPGDVGVAQLNNFMFSTRGPQPGCILIEWNMQDPLGQPGSCGMWDVHFRIGGAIGTSINPWNCGAEGGVISPSSTCTGTWALMHLTSTGSCYMENVWGWTADHDIDYGAKINVYNGRGFLCESQGPVWMYGTAMEHSAIYEYNFFQAQNVFAGMIQTETPYYQPSLAAPSVYDFGSDPSDPQFCPLAADYRCEMAYALSIRESEQVMIYGAGLYSWFNIWDQKCLHSKPVPTCQLNIVDFKNSVASYLFALNTHGSVYMLSLNETYSEASANVNTFCSTAIVDLAYQTSK